MRDSIGADCYKNITKVLSFCYIIGAVLNEAYFERVEIGAMDFKQMLLFIPPE